MDWDGLTKFWVSQMDDEEQGEFELLIQADSPMNFLAVRNTHQTFDRLMMNLDWTIEAAALEIVTNNGKHTKKSEKLYYGNLLAKTLSLSCLVLIADLSSEMFFSSFVWEESNLDGEIHVLLDSDGKIIDVHIDDNDFNHG